MKSLIDYAKEGNLPEVKNLLAQPGTNVHEVTHGGNTALHLAAFSGYTEVVKALLDKGANVNAVTYYNDTSLQFAAMNGNTETVKVLLDKGANLNAANNLGNTALHMAVSGNYTDITKLLLDKGAITTEDDVVRINNLLNGADLAKKRRLGTFTDTVQEQREEASKSKDIAQ